MECVTDTPAFASAGATKTIITIQTRQAAVSKVTG